MPIFDTPDPISVTLELGVGNVRIAGGDRTDTVVEVRPTEEADESDVKAAEQIRVDCSGGVLRVTGPKRTFDFSRKTKSVDITIEVPAGSQVSAEVQVGDFAATGRLGQCRFKTSTGDVRLERTGPLRLDTSAGRVAVDAVDGGAEVHTGSGKVRLGAVDGTAVVKNSNGDTEIGSVTGDARVRSANGDITIGRAGAGVDVKTANGAVRVDEVVRGAITLGTSMGDLEVGVAEGTAAWLEVDTGFGHVRNLLDTASGPGDSTDTVEVRAHTSHGDITIRRS